LPFCVFSFVGETGPRGAEVGLLTSSTLYNTTAIHDALRLPDAGITRERHENECKRMQVGLNVCFGRIGAGREAVKIAGEAVPGEPPK
jgi:hypothetical protein